MCFAIYDQTVVIDYSVYTHSRDKLVSFVKVCRLWTQSGLQRQTLDVIGVSGDVTLTVHGEN